MPGFHEFYDSEKDRDYKKSYINKKFIPPIFDEINVVQINENNNTIILKVSLNGKVGLLDVYRKKFLVPIIFDSITSFYFNESEESLKCCGIIDGEQYFYDGINFYKCEQRNMSSEPFNRVRKIIEK